jgi:predicted amidohydrolase YtcJ
MQLRALITLTTIFSGLAGCAKSVVPPADTVLLNGYIYTMDQQNSVQHALAVRDGVLVYVGSDAGAKAYIGNKTKVTDLSGHMLMPGFIDGHIHPSDGGRSLTLCNLNYEPSTRRQLQEKLQRCLDAEKEKEPDTWMEVVNWDRASTLKLDGEADKSTLDALQTTRPIQVRSTDYHTILTNTRGLKLAGITKATPDPADGKFLRNAKGEPNGLADDGAGRALVALVPPPSADEKMHQIQLALHAMSEQGITSFLDVIAGAESAKAYATLQSQGALNARAMLALVLDPKEATTDLTKAIARLQATARDHDQGAPKAAPGLRMRHLKLFVDGVINAPADTGALLEPYFKNTGTEAKPHWVPGNNTGKLYFSQDLLNKVVLTSVQAGFDPHFHTTGERAVRTVLNAIEYARQQAPASGFRPALAHNELVAVADYPRFKALNVTAVMSFQWAQQAPYSMGDTHDHLGTERFARMEPFGSIHNAGGRVAYGSDWPVDPLDTFLALKVAVTRAGDPANPHSYGAEMAGKLNEDPSLSRADALRAITMNAAEQLGIADVVGSIEVNKFADLIVLDRNFMQVPEEELARNDVLLTMVGGKVVFAGKQFSTTAP